MKYPDFVSETKCVRGFVSMPEVSTKQFILAEMCAIRLKIATRKAHSQISQYTPFEYSVGKVAPHIFS